MQTNTEHQQHHTDLGELLRQVEVGDETGRRRTDDDPGDQVAEQGRKLEAYRDEAQDQREPERGGNRGDQGDAVVHAAVTSRPSADGRAPRPRLPRCPTPVRWAGSTGRL